MKSGGRPITVKIVPEVITSLRERKGLSKNALARLTDISAAHIVNIEKGKQKVISREAAKVLADALDSPPERFSPDYLEKAEIPAPVKAKDFLTKADLETLAEEYFDFSLSVAKREAYRLCLDFSEAISISLFVLWKVVLDHDHTQIRNMKAYITQAIKGELIREYKASTKTYSLDAMAKDGGECDFYNFFCAKDDVFENFAIREEVLEAVRTMTEDQKKDRYIRDLMEECGLVPIPA